MTGLRARSRSYHRFGLTLPGALDLVMVKASKLSHMSGLLECTTFILQKARPKSKKGQVLTKVMGINGGNRTGSKDSTESFYQCQPSPTLFSHSSKKYLLNVYFVLSTEDTAVTKTDMVPDPHGAHSLVEETDLSPRTAPGGCAVWYVEA